LSGGLDSSAIVSALISEFGTNDLKTFSAVYDKGQYGDESAFIKLYEGKLENMFYTYPDKNSLLDDLERFIVIHAEPIPGTGPYAQFKVMELAQGKVVVTLDGQGADEILAGYHYFYGFYFKELLKRFRLFRLISEIYYYLKVHKSWYGLKTLVFLLIPPKFRTILRTREMNYIQEDFVNKFINSSYISSKLYSSSSLNDSLLDHFEYKMEHLLKWGDRNSMAFGIESRVPFLDHRLVEATLALDGRDIIKNGITKFPLRDAMKGVLPEKIRLRTDKIGFGTPQDDWLRSVEFQKVVNDILESSSFRNRKVINPEVAKNLYQRHLKKEINIGQEIWKWIHLELWFRHFIDRVA
jgi:asparagine synthase (glutamine-hydrolysing)